MIFKLKDGAVESVDTDNDCMDYGCPTCGFGSSYVNDVTITMTKHKIRASVDQMYQYEMSAGWLLSTIVKNIDQIQEMTELEFADWFKEQFETLGGEKDYMVYSI